MKKFYCLILTFIFILCTKAALAANYPIQAIQTLATDITVTMTGVTDTSTTFELYNAGSAIASGAQAINNTVTWHVSGNAVVANKTYFLYAVKPGTISITNPAGIGERVSPIIVFKTGTGGTLDFYKWPLDITLSSQQAKITGAIDTSKFGNVSDLDIQFQFSLAPFLPNQSADDVGSNNASFQKAQTNPSSTGGNDGIAVDGSYYFNLPSLTPSSTYYFRQVIRVAGTVVAINSDQFPSSGAYTPAGTQSAADADAKQAYNLLAPWPGLSKIYDPSVCVQKKEIEHTLDPNAICDVNDLLNFAFKTLIGLTSLLLVLRIMAEGYTILTSDVPFIQAKAKGDIKTMFLGLLVALSAYIILNTINPKLVKNDVTIDRISVEVDDEIETTPGNTYDVGGDTRSCPEGFIDVATFGNPNKINVCKTISQNLTAMLIAAKNSNIILLGYGSRSTERQKQLRIAHGCPNDSTPSSSCHPPTARPGRSMHERGMAIDFTCNGASITNHSNTCYIWLTTHADQYGFKNLPSEPWHWSVTGK